MGLAIRDKEGRMKVVPAHPSRKMPREGWGTQFFSWFANTR